MDMRQTVAFRFIILLGISAFSIGFLTLTQSASAQELKRGYLIGQLTDAATGTAIEGAHIHVLGTSYDAFTDVRGRWSLQLPDGSYELEIYANIDGRDYVSRVVNQRVPQYLFSRAYIYTTYFLDKGIPPLDHPMGLPTSSGKIDDDEPAGLDLHDVFPPTDVNGLGNFTIPPQQPATIRVGRRAEPERSCTNNPVVAIEEMSLDDYVQGVLPPEIGVFQNMTGAAEVYKAFAIAARSYGLYFVLRYHETNRRYVDSPLPPHNFDWFHIDDTACNQRYSDQRLAITTNAASAVASSIMVKKDDPTRIDKYEYAASCGTHGTRPEYQTSIVPDNPINSACAGNWCGHNACAAHEDNPNLPAGNRCLVRGICQWGAISWGAEGKTYDWLLEHYQPNVELRQLNNVDDTTHTVNVTGYAYTNPDDIAGSAISSVNIELSDGQTTLTNADGRFYFDEVDLALGTITITATKENFAPATHSRTLEPNVTNWASLRMYSSGSPPPEHPDEDDYDNTPITPPDVEDDDSDINPEDRDPPPANNGDWHSDEDPSDGDNPDRHATGLGSLITPAKADGVESLSACNLTPTQKPLSLAPYILGLAGVFIIRQRPSQKNVS